MNIRSRSVDVHWVLFGAASWMGCPWVNFTFCPFYHAQWLVEGGAGLLGHLLLNLIPDGNFKTLQGATEEIWLL